MALLYESLSNRVIEAAIEVHRELGPGFLEAIYESAMRLALKSREIQFVSQAEVEIFFGGKPIGFHRLDLIVENKIVIELKAIKTFEDIHYAQVRSYLKATTLQLGLLLNFNSPALAIKRIILTQGDRHQDDFEAP
jgi:GxxExxY protein